jgi:Amt family ammonium transporter
VNELSGGATIGKQTIGVAVTLGFSFLATLLILKVVDLLVGLRVPEEDEITGLDLSQHAEVGYTLQDRGGSPVHTTGPVPSPGPDHERVEADSEVRR